LNGTGGFLYQQHLPRTPSHYNPFTPERRALSYVDLPTPAQRDRGRRERSKTNIHNALDAAGNGGGRAHGDVTGEMLPFAGWGLYAAPAFRSFADAALDAPSARGATATIARREPGALYKEGAVMARTAALPALKAESGLSHYLEEIRRFPMLEPQEEYMLAKSWREHGDTQAAHRLVTSHLRLVAKIAMGYRGYGLPISEVVSEGNVGLMQAVKRFEPEKGFRLATYAMWWIKAAIQEYILRSWSLVKMGTTANQKKLFFNLRKAKSKISALEEGDLRPDQVQIIAKRLGVTERDVVDMNRRLGGDASLNAPIRDDGESGEWQDWLVDDAPTQERILADSEESDNRHNALIGALDVLNERERRIFEARRLADDPVTLEDLASEFGVSRERVRQIEVRAFEKVQKAVKNRMAAMEQPHQPDAIAAH
jgi:RNA polymerase sigma-32 factor